MSKTSDWLLAVIGVAAAAAGVYLLTSLKAEQGIMLILPYILIGLGCGLFGHGMGDLFSKRQEKTNPQKAKEMATERADERNIMINYMAKARAFHLMIFVYAALLLVFAVMNIGLAAILLLTAAYIFVIGSYIYYRLKLEKEM